MAIFNLYLSNAGFNSPGKMYKFDLIISTHWFYHNTTVVYDQKYKRQIWFCFGNGMTDFKIGKDVEQNVFGICVRRTSKAY